MAIDARWSTPVGALRLWEPSTDEVALAAPRLADFYNEPHNHTLLGNTVMLAPPDVIDLWVSAARGGARSFLFSQEGAVIGDADLRNLRGDAAEVALLVGPRHLQGKGLGRRLLAMLLRVGFDEVGVARMYASIKPENTASLRLFGRAGFARDDGAEARSFADDPRDVCLAIDRSSWSRDDEGEAESRIAITTTR